MKTSQDFNENFNQYSSEIEKEMSNLNRMLQEFASNGVVAQQIINDLEPVLAKLHLTIDSFTMNRPDKEKASNRGRLIQSFDLISFRGQQGNYVGEWVIRTEDARYIFKTSCILAGGYNIQCLHARYIANLKQVKK